MNIRAVVLNDELGAIAYVLKRMGYDVAAIYVKENKSAEICKYNDVAKEVITTDILEVNNADIPYADVVAGQMPYRAARKLRNEIMIESDNRYLNKYKDILLAKRPGFSSLKQVKQ